MIDRQGSYVSGLHQRVKELESQLAVKDAENARLKEALEKALAFGIETAQHCPCGARPESLDTHPHVVSCPVEKLIATLNKALSPSVQPFEFVPAQYNQAMVESPDLIATMTVREIGGKWTADWFTEDGKFGHCDALSYPDALAKGEQFARCFDGATLLRLVTLEDFVQRCEAAGYQLPSPAMRGES